MFLIRSASITWTTGRIWTAHDDLQEQCIRRNSLGPLEEQILEWYADQEHDNLQGYLSEIRNEMEADGKSAEYIRHEEKIKDLLYERNNTDPAVDTN
ncbi:hypothetical protein [Phocaeicola sp.]|uniref:hypothetical protein n=1 Tax=Phocaeicola sp. TaxID=2773926 RepID=UPI003AB829B1